MSSLINNEIQILIYDPRTTGQTIMSIGIVRWNSASQSTYGIGLQGFSGTFVDEMISQLLGEDNCYLKII